MTAPAVQNTGRTVKAALTPHLPPRSGRRTGRTDRPAVENSDYTAFLRRAIRSAGKRVGGGDVDGLADLLSLAGELDRAIDAAVRGLRDAGYSWVRSPPGWVCPGKRPSSAGVIRGEPGQPVSVPVLGP